MNLCVKAIFGMLAAGLSDRVGRRPVLVMCNLPWWVLQSDYDELCRYPGIMRRSRRNQDPYQSMILLNACNCLASKQS